MSLALIAVLGAAGLFLTDFPPLVALAMAAGCLGWGGVLVRAELRRGRMALALRANGLAEIDGVPVDDFAVDWRGPLACLSWLAAGRRTRFVAWPDIIDPAARRELRLWVAAHRAPAVTATVAP